MSQVKPIRSDKEYEQALTCVAELIEPGFVSKLEDIDEIEMLVHAIDEYEQRRFPINPPHAIEELIEDELDARLVEERRGQAEIEIKIDDL